MRKSDEQLIEAYLEGDDSSLAVLVDRYVDDLYRFAFHMTRDAQASEDVAQESFIKAWKNIRKYRAGSNFKSWLFTIARNTAIDLLRQKKEIALSSFENEQGENTLLAALADEGLLPDELLVRAEDTAYVQALLAEINPAYRDVLTLRYEQDLTFEEIGKLLKRPLHTVKSQHRRALALLRRLIEAPAY